MSLSCRFVDFLRSFGALGVKQSSKPEWPYQSPYSFHNSRREQGLSHSAVFQISASHQPRIVVARFVNVDWDQTWDFTAERRMA
jgi:hypothetical protein